MVSAGAVLPKEVVEMLKPRYVAPPIKIVPILFLYFIIAF